MSFRRNFVLANFPVGSKQGILLLDTFQRHGCDKEVPRPQGKGSVRESPTVRQPDGGRKTPWMLQ